MPRNRQWIEVPDDFPEAPRNGIRGLLENASKLQNVGRSVTIDRIQGVQSQPKTPLLKVQGSDEVAELVTVTLSVLSTPVAADEIFLTAVVSWGVGTGTSCEIDFINGCTFQLAASSVEVSVRDDSSNLGVLLKTVAAFVAYGPSAKASGQRPRKTIEVPTIAALGSASFFVPDFATDVRYVRTLAARPFRLDYMKGNVLIGEVSVGANQDMAPVDIPGNCTRIVVNNLDAVVAIANGALTFGISL